MKFINVSGLHRRYDGETLTECTRVEQEWGSHGLGVGKRSWGRTSGLGMHDLNMLLQGPASPCMTTHLLSPLMK